MDFSGDPWNFYGFLGGLLGISMDFLGDSWSFYGFLEIPVFFFPRVSSSPQFQATV